MIRYPNIIGKSDSQKLAQMSSYLHQLADELNYQLDKTGNLMSGYASTANDIEKAVTKKNDPVSNFNDIKALIIKSADIVDAYYTEINKKLEGQYVAESDFGTFKQETEAQLTANSERIEIVFTNQESISTDLESVKGFNRDIKAYIQFGELYGENGETFYGLELGQTTEVDGGKVFSKFVRLTADKLSFYDENGTEVAYASGQRFVSPSMEAKELYIGGFKVFPRDNGNLSIRWIGG